MNEWILEFMWDNDQELLYNINNIEYDKIKNWIKWIHHGSKMDQG